MKRIIVPLLALCLLLYSLPVHAAATVPINHGNKYTYSVTGGEYTWEVPFTGNYKVTLSGTEGASYSAGSGGYGTQLVKVVRLVKGTQLCVVLPARPNYTSGETVVVPSGNNAELYLDGDLYMLAGGGGARINNNIAPNGCTQVNVGSNGSVLSLGVHWHSGNGKSGPVASNTFPTVYKETLVGGCYRWSGHTHNATRTCPWRYTYHEHRNCSYTQIDTVICTGRGGGYSYFECTACGAEYSHYDGGASTGWGWGYCNCPGSREYHCDRTPNAGLEYTCGNPRNTQTIQCGFKHGQINPVTNRYTPTPCFGPYDSAAANNTGDAKFSIELCEQDTLFYSNVTPTYTYYNGGLTELVLVDDIVCYYKRR